MAAATREQYIRLAKALPGQLQRFLARWPPAAILPPSADPDAPFTHDQAAKPNPFARQKNEATGRWHDPVYSMRRQAQLVKLARQHGVEELLPPSSKGTETRLAKRVEFGLRVKGTGVGQRVKGHAHERQLLVKMAERRQAMMEMPKLIRDWKRIGRANWKKWPR